MDKALDIKNNAKSFTENILLESLAYVFDSLDVDTKQIIRLDKLTINVNGIQITDRQELIHQIDEQIKKQIRTAIEENNTLKSKSNTTVFQSFSATEKPIHTFLHVIKHGTIPWWEKSVTDVKKLFESSSLANLFNEFAYLLKEEFSSLLLQNTIFERLVLQLPDERIAQLLSLIKPEKERLFELDNVKKSNLANRVLTWSFIFQWKGVFNGTFEKTIAFSSNDKLLSLVLELNKLSSEIIPAEKQAELALVWLKLSNRNRLKPMFWKAFIKKELSNQTIHEVVTLVKQGLPHLEEIKIEGNEIQHDDQPKGGVIKGEISQKDIFTSFLDYLDKGFVPESLFEMVRKKLTSKELITILIKYKETILQTLEKTKSNEIVLKRFTQEFFGEELLYLFGELFGSRELIIPFYSQIAVLKNHHKELFWSELLTKISTLKNKQDLPELISQILSKTISADMERVLGSRLEEKVKDQTEKTECFVEKINKQLQSQNQTKKLRLLEENGVIMENAGLILIHPFIKPLFQNLDLLSKEGELTQSEIAVHLLHYIASGTEQDFEFSMQFEKFLCELPQDYVLKKEVVLSSEMKEEAGAVLSSTLEYWKALKSKSTQLLQNEFLQRPAKVIEEEGAIRLVFERKAFDIMLDHIPWSLGMIQLPWKREMIHVEW